MLNCKPFWTYQDRYFFASRLWVGYYHVTQPSRSLSTVSRSRTSCHWSPLDPEISPFKARGEAKVKLKSCTDMWQPLARQYRLFKRSQSRRLVQ